jgi:hypothetical protein
MHCKMLSKSNCSQQECLWMTPLHILTCSSLHHDLKLYCMLIETYPEQLITKDKWGALPLLYAIWGAVLSEVIQLLLKSYQQYFPDYKFEWTCMVETMGLRYNNKHKSRYITGSTNASNLYHTWINTGICHGYT